MFHPRLTALLVALSAAAPLALTAAPATAADDVDIGCVAHSTYDRLFTEGPYIPHVAQKSWFVPQGLTGGRSATG